MFIGWDVGGWNCDKNSKSRDALVVVDREGTQIGQPWWGNLRETINAAASAQSLVAGILDLCEIRQPADSAQATLAIDAPLGFPEALAKLINGGTTASSIEESAANPYLYRFTERRLVAEGLTPLSVTKDMIGSQSTKAMHVVARFCPELVEPGVWSDKNCLQVIETYPTLCRRRTGSTREADVTAKQGRRADICDAVICARIARDFAVHRDKLEAPQPESPLSEGWIWAPLPRSL